MKRNLLLLMLMALCMAAATPMMAQVKKKSSKKADKDKTEAYFDEKGGIKHRLWYGGGLNLGYNADNGFSVFNFGLSPMVGYKLIGNLSAGPRVRFDFSSYKVQAATNVVYSAKPITAAAGLFTRYKILNMFFLHGELGYTWEKTVVDPATGNFNIDPNGDRKLQLYKNNFTNMVGGVGYTQGGEGTLGFEIGVYYDFGRDTENTYLQPVEFRLGFNYNF